MIIAILGCIIVMGEFSLSHSPSQNLMTRFLTFCNSSYNFERSLLHFNFLILNKPLYHMYICHSSSLKDL